MELLPIIYNSLLIAAGLFVITVVISYISYKIKGEKRLVDETDKTAGLKSVSREKLKVQQELKPHYKDKQHKSSSHHSESRIEKKKVAKHSPNQKRKPEASKPHKPKPEQREESGKTRRIERVTELAPNSREIKDRETKKVEQRKTKTQETKNKKKLKSIDDDPLKKYTDSADDDFHPLKTDD